METSLFTTFKPIISFQNQSKEDLAQYYKENKLTPNNEYLEKYISNLTDIPISESVNITPTSTESLPTSVGFKRPELILNPTSKSSPTFNLSNLSEKDKAKKIVNYFMDKGLTKEQAAGIAGNYHAESGFNSEILGDNGSSFGIAQWRGPRLEKLKEFSTMKGLPSNSIEAQLEFTWHELQTSENSALKSLLKTKTAKDAAKIFSDKYERPKVYNKHREIKAEEFRLA